jgi:hypothetical protein
MLFWWACPLVDLRLEQSHNCVSGRILRLRSRICDSSHKWHHQYATPAAYMCLWSHKCDSSYKCASSVTTCDPGHMLTLCAWDCTFEHHLWCHSMSIFNNNVCLSHTFATQSYFCHHSSHNSCTHTTRQFMYIQEFPKGGTGHPFSLLGGLRPLITRFVSITFTSHFIPFTLSLSTFTLSASTRISYSCCITSKGY